MKIRLYGINFAPELTGIGKYTGELAAWLAARGHQVRVVTAPPYYPAWAVSPGYNGSAYRTEQWQGVTVLRCPLWVPRQPGGAKRLLHLASFALSSLPELLAQVFWRPNLVWVVEPALFCAPAAVTVARLSGARAWLATADIHLLPQRADAADLVMPSKLTGMLASARAVVATAHAGTELANVVQTCGLLVPPEDPAALAQAIHTLALDAALRERLGAAGYLYAQAHLDRDAVLQRFEGDVLKLLSNA